MPIGDTRDLFYNQPHIQRVLDEFDRKERAMHPGRRFGPVEIAEDYLGELKRLGRPLPCWNGRPNVVRIARQCGLHRHAIDRNPRVARMRNRFALFFDRNVES